MEIIIDILARLGDWLTWIFTAEERLALLMNGYDVSIKKQIAVLTLVNMVLILIELLIIHVLSYLPLIKRIRTPRIIKKLAHDKPVTYQDLFLFAFTPGMQKFGVIAYYARRQRLGIIGYIALALGGMSRVSTYPFMGNFIWILIAALLAIRVFFWWHANNQSGTKN